MLLVMSAFTFTACTSEEERLRQMRYGFRKLNLPTQLKNDEMQLSNDGLENDLAKMEGRRKKLDRVAIDQFMVDQARAARVNDFETLRSGV